MSPGAASPAGITRSGRRCWANASGGSDASYICVVAFLKTDNRESLALVVPRGTGSTGPDRRFDNHVNARMSARIDGRWRIAGSFHRDVTPN